jgi:hypothetical protein
MSRMAQMDEVTGYHPKSRDAQQRHRRQLNSIKEGSKRVPNCTVDDVAVDVCLFPAAGLRRVSAAGANVCGPANNAHPSVSHAMTVIHSETRVGK